MSLNLLLGRGPISIFHADCFAFHAAESTVEDSSKYGRNRCETMTLRKEGDGGD